MFKACTSLIFFLSGVAFAEPILFEADSSISAKMIVEASINGAKDKFLLDTGAYATTLRVDTQSKSLSPVGHVRVGAAQGIGAECDLVKIDQLQFASANLSGATVQRCPSPQNLLGLDLLSEKIFSLNFSNSEFSFLNALPSGLEMLPLTRGQAGHLKLPLKVAGESTQAVFDTGWSITSIDSDFIASHPKDFTPVKVSAGAKSTDANRHEAEVRLFFVKELRIGNLVLRDQIVEAFKLPDGFEDTLGGDVGAMIGTSSMVGADWVFDLKNNLWSARPRANYFLK